MRIKMRKLGLVLRRLTLLALLLSASGVSVRAHPGTISVDRNDPDCAPETGQPDPYSVVYCNIQDAIDDASAGDTVNVATGTYTENVTITKSLTLQAASAPVLDGTDIGGTGVAIDASDVSLTGFKIQNYATGVEIRSGTNVSVISNDIRGNIADTGILVRDGAAVDNEACLNNIVGNDVGVKNEDPDDTFDAMDNWWGCNEGPNKDACDTVTGMVDAKPWLVLKLTADPTLVVVDGGTSALTADLTYNSSGLDTSSLGHIPDATTTTFTATLGTVTPEITGTVDGIAASTFTAGSIAGSAVVSATVDSETVTTTLAVEQVDLQIHKTDDAAIVRPGDILTYILTIINNSGVDATGVVVTETLPASTTFVSPLGWHQVDSTGVYTREVGSLGAGSSYTTTFIVAVDSPVPAGLDTITNTAEVADDGTHGVDANPDDNEGRDVDSLDAAPDLVISKTDGIIEVQAGGVVTYTLTITNAGDQGATGVVVTETLPVSTTFVGPSGWQQVGSTDVYTHEVGNLAGGGAIYTTTFVVAVDSPLPAGLHSITNTVSVGDDGANGADPNPDDNSDEDVNDVDAAPDLVVSKTDGRTVVEPGDTVTYTLTVVNAGTQDATGVVVTDTLPAHTAFITVSQGGTASNGVVTWPAFDLAAGDFVTRTVTVEVDDPVSWPAGVEVITNTAEVSDDGTNGADLDPDDNIASDVDGVDVAPDLLLFKTDNKRSAALGELVSYTLSYRNKGTQDTSGVVITETVPANTMFNASASTSGWQQVGATDVYTLNVGMLAAGAEGTVIFAVTVNETLPAGEDAIVNVAYIDDDGTSGPDMNPGDNSDDDVNSVTAAPDLVVVKTDGRTVVEAGDLITYTLTISNAGTQGATGIAVTDELPAHTSFIAASHGGTVSGDVVTWPGFSLAAGDLTTRTVTVELDDPVLAGVEMITNRASVADDGANGPDLNPSDNSAEDVDGVVAAPDLIVVKTDDRTYVKLGEVLTYTLTISNDGTQGATGVVVTDTLPMHTDFVTASPGYSEVSGVVTWPAFNLAAGDVVTRTVTVRVDAPWPAGVTIITNTASVADDGANGDDLTPSNNVGDDTTRVLAYGVYLPLVHK